MINTYSTFNLGDAAIYSALARLIGGEQPVVATVQDVVPLSVPGISFVDALGPCDTYVSVGGDIFNNSREWLITKQFLINLRELRRHPSRTILFGQSLPRSCHGLSLRLLSRSLRRLAAVCVRDEESHRRLLQRGVPAQLSYDTAFALELEAPAQAQARELMTLQGLDPTSLALLSVRAFDSMYGHDNQRFLSQMAGLCRELVKAQLQPVVLIQSQAYGADNDLQVAAAIAAEVPQVAIFNPFTGPTGPWAHWQIAMAALSLARLVVGIRYHTTVLSLAAGRLPYNLYYSNKGRDLSERLELPGCNLKAFDPADQIATILASADRPFAVEPIREHVRRSFMAALAAAGPSHSPSMQP
ncbi:polysaccharide pyruvyl transferase family protein [Cyanobium sp. Morenito 9A2]|nr:polysaccharide pyruvyl transferase family protein [Cyanobium sp. Morenito 9A2]